MSSPDRFEAAIRANGRALLAYFERRLPDLEDAADAYAELLTTAWRARRRLPVGETDARMWLYGVARNVLRHQARAHARRTASASALREQLEILASSIPPARHDGLRDAIAALPDDDAELVRLVYWDGLPSHEAGQIIGINPSTARSRLVRIRSAIRAELEHDASIDDEVARTRP